VGVTQHPREAWEEAGYRIADHTGSPPVDPLELWYTVNHYPALLRLATSDPVAFFRAVQRGYVRDRGYSIGYSWGYWPDGSEWELRGMDYRNAANAADDPERVDENRHSVSLFFVVVGQGAAGQPATGPQITAARRRLELVHEAAGRELPNIEHADLEPTQCAGAGISAQTAAGMFLPRPTTPPTPTQGVPTMYRLVITQRPPWPSSVELTVTAFEVLHNKSGVTGQVDTRAGVPTVTGADHELVEILRDRRPVGPSPFVGAWSDPTLHAAWEAAR
jgi:hypothetical protein